MPFKSATIFLSVDSQDFQSLNEAGRCRIAILTTQGQGVELDGL